MNVEFNLRMGKLADELRKLWLRRKYDINGPTVVFREPQIQVQGIFRDEVWEHPDVIRAMEDGDMEREMWVREWVLRVGQRHEYVQISSADTPNRVVNDGLDFVLNLLFYTTSKISTWYYGPFTSNWMPGATSQSNWAGISSGPVATELPDASFNESGRQAATFGSAASSQAIETSATTDVTIATGISGVSIYGHTLNESATVAYNSTDKILLSGTRRSEALTGLAAGSVLKLGYSFGVSST